MSSERALHATKESAGKTFAARVTTPAPTESSWLPDSKKLLPGVSAGSPNTGLRCWRATRRGDGHQKGVMPSHPVATVTWATCIVVAPSLPATPAGQGIVPSSRGGAGVAGDSGALPLESRGGSTRSGERLPAVFPPQPDAPRARSGRRAVIPFGPRLRCIRTNVRVKSGPMKTR